MSRGGTQKRVSLGLHPVSLRKSKEMGWNGQGQRGLLPKKTAHTCKAKDKAASSLCFLRVRRYVGRWLMACPAIRHYFFGACPKKRCRAAKEKRFFTLVAPPFALSLLPRWSGLIFARLGEGLGGLTGRSSQLDAVGCDVGASSSWERRAGPNSSRGGTHKRVSLGLHPVSLRKSKEMGWNGQ